MIKIHRKNCYNIKFFNLIIDITNAHKLNIIN